MNTARIARLVVKHARDAFASDEAIAARVARPELHGAARPRRARLASHDAFLRTSREPRRAASSAAAGGRRGARFDLRRAMRRSRARRGMILCHMGKPQRAGRARRAGGGLPALARPDRRRDRPARTDRRRRRRVVRRPDAGRRPRLSHQRRRASGSFGRCLGRTSEVVEVPLPHWRGPGDVFHLMSVISPVDRDLAVVYPPLMPVPFLEWLLAPRHRARRGAGRGIRLDGRERAGDCAARLS